MGKSPQRGMPRSGRGDTDKRVVGCAAEALPAAETAEAEQGQRSAFCKRAPPRAAKTGHRNPDGLDQI